MCTERPLCPRRNRTHIPRTTPSRPTRALLFSALFVATCLSAVTPALASAQNAGEDSLDAIRSRVRSSKPGGPDAAWSKLAEADVLMRDPALIGENRTKGRQLIADAVAMAPEDPVILYQAGRILSSRGEVSRSIPYLKRFIEVGDRRSQTWRTTAKDLGRHYLSEARGADGGLAQQQACTNAERFLLAALESAREAEDSYLSSQAAEALADVSALQGREAAQKRYLFSLLDHPFGFREDYGAVLVGLVLREGKLDEAHTLLENLEDEGARSGQLLMLWAQLHRRRGDFDTALQYVDAWLSTMRAGFASSFAESEAAWAKATIYAEAGEPDVSIEWARKAYELNSSPVGANNLAWFLAIGSEAGAPALEEALAYSLEAVESEPTPGNYDTLAEVYFRMGDYDLAEQTWDEAIHMAPTENYLREQRDKVERARSGQPATGVRRVTPWKIPEAM